MFMSILTLRRMSIYMGMVMTNGFDILATA